MFIEYLSRKSSKENLKNIIRGSERKISIEKFSIARRNTETIAYHLKENIVSQKALRQIKFSIISKVKNCIN